MGKNRLLWGMELLKQDIYGLRYALLGLFLYTVTVHVLFGEFCPMQILLRLPCPGCGMTRAFVLVLTGRFAEAWALHPLVYGWMILGVWFVLERYFFFVRTKGIRLFLLLLLLATVGCYVWRIFYGFPAELLA